MALCQDGKSGGSSPAPVLILVILPWCVAHGPLARRSAPLFDNALLCCGTRQARRCGQPAFVAPLFKRRAWSRSCLGPRLGLCSGSTCLLYRLVTLHQQMCHIIQKQLVSWLPIARHLKRRLRPAVLQTICGPPGLRLSVDTPRQRTCTCPKVRMGNDHSHLCTAAQGTLVLRAVPANQLPPQGHANCHAPTQASQSRRQPATSAHGRVHTATTHMPRVLLSRPVSLAYKHATGGATKTNTKKIRGH